MDNKSISKEGGSTEEKVSFNNISKDDNILKNKRSSLENIKSGIILKKIFNNTTKKKTMKFCIYNKSLQKRLNINLNDYKNRYLEIHSPIEIEIIPKEKGIITFIDFSKVDYHDYCYYHIYINDMKEEIKNIYSINYIISKIKIIIDEQIKSFKYLFKDCSYIESISFKQMYRTNITDMSGMFLGCSSLKKLDTSNFKTNSVTDMSAMFSGCSKLEEINVSNFNTNKVKDMWSMFRNCSSLKELDISNFNTNNVKDMSAMFCGCSSLEELKISKFDISKVKDMKNMFNECSEQLKMKIRNENIFKEEAFV